MKITIDVVTDVENSHFLLEGDIDLLLGNKRLVLSFKRLAYSFVDATLHIPFRQETQISVLCEIQKLLDKFNFAYELKSATLHELGHYEREVNLFNVFAGNAKSIRNNEFDSNPDLVRNFRHFKNVLADKLKRRLYPLQLLSSFHMAFAQNSCNFAVPGAGKTSIVFGAYSYLKSLPADDPKHIDFLLVVGPISSFAPWENEYQACYGTTTTFRRLSGDADVSRNAKLEHLYSATPSEVTLIFHGGVDSFKIDLIDFLKRNKTMVVIDEAHRIKNPEGVWGKSVIEISKFAVSRIILTGTPVPNGYQDIYNLFKFIYPFKYQDILQFHFHNLEEMTRNCEQQSQKVQTLKDNISPFFIRIKKSDLDLPPTKNVVLEIEMGSYQKEIYKFIEAKYIESFKFNESATVKSILNKAKLIRLRQASTNPSLLSKTLIDSLENNFTSNEFDPNSIYITEVDEYINDSEYFNKIINYSKCEIPTKFKKIFNLIECEILPVNAKVIIWTIFIQNAKELKRYLLDQNIPSKLLIGEIPQHERENTIEKFNDPSNLEFQVVIANPFSVAESISLHKGCHNAIYMERDYSATNFIQSKDRIHRVGLNQNQLTCYYYLITTNSIDEIINRRLQVKVNRMEQMVNDDIPLFSLIDDGDETDIVKELLREYARRS